MDDQEITTGFLFHIHGQFQQACSAAALAGWLLSQKDGATGGEFSVNPLVLVVHRLERAREGVDSVGLVDRRDCDERKELLESEQWLAL
jgi:hypothetical protein